MPRSSLALLALVLIGCRSGSVRPASPEVPPRLLGCASYTEPQPATNVHVRVELEFEVQADGRVREGSHRLHSGRYRSRDPLWVDRATRDALSCSYEPARHAGRDVGASVRKVFSYAR